MADLSNNVDLPGEKAAWPQNSDASSGQVETIEQAPGPDTEIVDKATERAVLRKLDYRIVPMVMWVYLMNMMDRGESLNSLKAGYVTERNAQLTLGTPDYSAWKMT